MTVVFDIVAKVRPDDFARIPLVDLSLLGSGIVFLGVDAVLDNCSMLVLIVYVVNSSLIESWIGLVMELVMESVMVSVLESVMVSVLESVMESVMQPVMKSVIGPATGSVIRLVLKLGIWILFSLIRSAMTLVIGPVMTIPAIGLVMELGMEPVMESVIGLATGSGIRLEMKPRIWILFSVIRPVIGPVMSPETKPVIEPGLVPVM